MKLIAVTLVVVAAGCGPGGLPADDSDGGVTPATGIYRLSRTSTGDCTPAVADAGLDAFVIQDQPGALRILVPQPSFGPPQGLGLTWMTEILQDGKTTLPSDLCGARVSDTLTTEQATSDHLRVRRVEIFSDVAESTCSPTARPTNDCTLTTELDYQLTQPCSSLCIDAELLDAGLSTGFPTLSCIC
jgi:hypothetical protein